MQSKFVTAYNALFDLETVEIIEGYLSKDIYRIEPRKCLLNGHQSIKVNMKSRLTDQSSKA